MDAPQAVSSACPLDCPDTCTLEVAVEAGQAVRLAGREANPATGGFLCAKVRRFAVHLRHPERVGQPGIRTGAKGSGSFRAAGWDEALDAVARRLLAVRRRHGGEAILPLCYGGSNGLLTQDAADARFFRRLGATRLARTVCAAPSGTAAAGLYGRMPGVACEDYPAARLIVVWGANPAASSVHLLPFIRRARARGARLVVVDPRRTPLAATADLHLPVRPGGDLAAALAVIRHLFEDRQADVAFLEARTRGWQELRRRAEEWDFDRAASAAGLEARQLEAFARMYAESRPAVIRCGWGLERNRNGGSAVAAVLALPAIAGKFGVRGGGYTLSNSAATGLSSEAAAAAPEPATRIVNMNRTGELLLRGDPPVKALFVYNCNPAATLPEQEKVLRGLAREDLFTVVSDAVHTDTARFADVILPATTFLEHDDLRAAYGFQGAARVTPALAPVGGARPNYAVFSELCHRTGLAQPGDPETPAAMLEAILAAHPDGRRIGAELAAEGVARPAAGGRPVQFVDVQPRTADGRVHLVPEGLDAEAPSGLYTFQADPGTAEFPLALISPACSRTISSTFGQLRTGPARLELHPADAGARGIAGGSPVRVFNRSGEVHTSAQLTSSLRPGVAVLPKGLWLRHTANHRTANALCPDDLADLGGGACFNDARVQVERRPDP